MLAAAGPPPMRRPMRAARPLVHAPPARPVICLTPLASKLLSAFCQAPASSRRWRTGGAPSAADLGIGTLS